MKATPCAELARGLKRQSSANSRVIFNTRTKATNSVLERVAFGKNPLHWISVSAFPCRDKQTPNLRNLQND